MMKMTRNTAALAALSLLLGLGACEKVPTTQSGDTASEASDRPALLAALDDSGDLSSARTLIKQAGLDKALSGPAPYTMFLPTDEALKALDSETTERLTSEEGRPELIALLRYHITPGFIAATDLMTAINGGGGSVKLANVAQSTLTFEKQGERIGIGSGDQAAMIVGDPIETTNGVIYRIDRLIAPQE